MDVGGWLRGLGLGQYEEQFRDNKIDADLLPRLTVDDLKDIGVSVVGDRRRLLDAIAVMANAGLSADLPASQTKSAPSKGLQGSAERRPITVMFCDLVGSTSLAAKLDAEDWRNLVNAYLDQASAAVTALGGHVLKKLGDGLMALFGYPHAQENDAERAVRAALAIQRALVEINARNAGKGAPELSARIGLDSGQVVVDATGEVFGDAPNLAARVQAAAEPGSVLITGNVQRQVAGLFVVEEKGAHELKGVARPQSLYRVVRASGGGRRAGARALTPLVGREEELDLLTRRWDRAHKGEGQLALIVGEPGLGKSRLMAEFHGRLGETPHTWVEWSSSQLLQNTPLHPIAEWGRQRFDADLSGALRLADLENTLRLIGLDPAEYAPLLAPLVDVPLPEGRVAKLAPEELRRRQLAAMTAWVLASARMQAVVLAFEDLHWADPTSLDLMRALADRGAQASLLIIATTRPEFRPPWSVRSHHSVISLSPLDHVQITKMVSELSAHHALPRDIVEGVSERTGGVPLFVEEVTRLLLERGDQGGAQAIPPTLQQSLAARLDRLGPAREVAQVGAVLGRDFVYALLRDVAEIDEPALQASLERLADADLLFVEGAPPEAKYRFKHALIQDAAYESLLKSRRQALHARAAEALREANAEPEAIAHHFTEAGLDDFAIEWWGKAGDQALRRSAFQEAIAHLGKAIEMADKAAGGKVAGERLHLQTAYGNALIAARGHGARETTEAFAKARESAGGQRDAPGRLAADYGLWVGSYTRGELSAMREHAAAFLADVEANPHSSEAGVAHRAAGITHWFAGEYRQAQECLERALALFQPGRDDDLAFTFGQDAGAAVMLYLAYTLWALGEVERAASLVVDAEARLAALGHIGTRAHGRMHTAMFALMGGDLSRAELNAVELARLTREHDLQMWGAWGVFLEGLASAQISIAGDGLEGIRRGIELLRERHILPFNGLCKIALAEAEARAGDTARALAILDEALATSERTGHRAFDAELHRSRGELLLKRDPTNPAPGEEALRAAIAVAKQQGTRSFELRAALSLAKMYQSIGRPAEANAVLAPALVGFSPMPEMPEIAEAQALLTALAATDEIKAEATRRQRLTQLHVAHGNALIAARGFGAAETAEAFAKALESAVGGKDAPERLAADYGLWAGDFVRGELPSMRAHSAAFLGDVEARPDSPEAGVAHRAVGITCWFAGEYREARDHLERALALFQPGRDDDLAFRFGPDAGVLAMHYLALTLWPMGDVARAVSLVGRAEARIADLTHVGTLAPGRMHAAMFDLMRGDRARGAANAFELTRLAREFDLNLFRAFSVFLEGWASTASGASGSGLEGMRRGVELLREQNVLWFDGLLKMALAEAEAQWGDAGRAVGIFDETLATCDRTGCRAFEAELHRARGETLLKCDPTNPAPAKEAFLTAIAVSRQQGARSFELRAALSLAELYQSTARPLEAHDILVPALEGFAPTNEMPEIAEAQALLAVLADTEEVKVAEAQRQRRLHLQTSYGQAMMWAKGFAAEETRAAFSHATELTAKTDRFEDRFAAAHFQWTLAFLRGELQSARALELSFLKEAEDTGRVVEAGVARRGLALACYQAGDFLEARTHCERALEACDAECDRETQERFHDATGPVVMSVLAVTMWQVGEVDRARELIEQANRLGSELGHGPSMTHPLLWKAHLEILRGDPAAALSAAEALDDLGREHRMPFWRTDAGLSAGWARGRLHVAATGAEDLRRVLADRVHQGARYNAWFYNGLLAELEAETLGLESALMRIDEAIALARQVENRCNLTFPHLLRGQLLLKRDPLNPAPAEEAFETALEIAKQQGARSWGLRAALSLAKLYQSTARPVDAHAVLATALEGFSPTPKMPEIAEAQTLLASLAETDDVRAGLSRRGQRLRLQTAYSQAMMMTKGYAAEETKAAFARAAELAEGTHEFLERFAALQGQWAAACTRGELRSVREPASAFLREAEDAGRVEEAGIANFWLGLVAYWQGDFVEARTHYERGFAARDPNSDPKVRDGFGDDRTWASAIFAVIMWQLGEVERARELIESAARRAAEIGHIGGIADVLFWKSYLEIWRDDPLATLSAAEALETVARKHGLAQWLSEAELHLSWARARINDPMAGVAQVRQVLTAFVDQDIRVNLGFYTGLLAQLEAETLGPESALARVDEAFRLSNQVEHRCSLPFLHRLRGEILLKRNPPDTALAEETFVASIGIAKEQRARSPALLAALALARLYQSNDRLAEAHAVLMPALESFSPTPEMPEIAEAQALLVAIADAAHLTHE
jgi:class 3 adenylate cyclase/predicted ATPase